MLRSHLLLAFGTAGLLCFNVAACGDDTGPGGAGGGTQVGVQPPGRPSGAGPGDGAGVVFGVSHIYIGTKTRAGVEDAKAWADFGYDLDQQITTNDFNNHCTPAGGGAPKTVFPDGNNGIDNSFGKYLLPIIKTAASSLGGGDLEAELNSAITDGDFNLMLDLRQLGANANYDPIATYLYAGKDGVGSNWLLVPEFFTPQPPASMTPPGTNILDTTKVKFPNSYVNEHVWVSGDKGQVDLSFAISDATFTLAIRSAVITMKMDPSRATATEGVIAGVLDTEELINQVREILGPFISCEGAGVDGILNQIRQGSDIMKDGSNGPGQECNGISIGIGFDAKPVQIVGVGEPSGPGEDPCAEGGGGAGGGTTSSSSSSASSSSSSGGG
jgi:hypothetical protein